jgi:hypothetical protein
VTKPGRAVVDVMLVVDGAGLAATGDAPCVDEDSDSLGGLSAEKDTPDCRMSSRRIRISDCCRFRLYDIWHGMSFCSSPFR